jgi:hypothetical protein
MQQSEVTDFANYYVYHYVKVAEGAKGIKKETICLCKDAKHAEYIAKFYAFNDKDGDTYYYSNVSVPNTMVPGGGWYEGFKREGDKLKRVSLG